MRLDSLQVVGYADALTDAMLPTIVPPLFRTESTPPVYLLPPYSIEDGVLANFVEVSQIEVESMEAAEEITLFEVPLAVGGEGFELWIDQHRQPRYELRGTVLAELTTRAGTSLDDAEHLLRAYDLDAASVRVSAAIASGSERYMVRALALKAAVRRLQNRPGSVAVLADMAAAFIASAAFHKQVDHYVALAGTKPVGVRRAESNGPMHDIVTLRAA